MTHWSGLLAVLLAVGAAGAFTPTSGYEERSLHGLSLIHI